MPPLSDCTGWPEEPSTLPLESLSPEVFRDAPLPGHGSQSQGGVEVHEVVPEEPVPDPLPLPLPEPDDEPEPELEIELLSEPEDDPEPLDDEEKEELMIQVIWLERNGGKNTSHPPSFRALSKTFDGV